MADFKQMYTRLFNRVTDAVTVLQEAQAEAEETFMDAEEAIIIVLDPENDPKTP